MTDSSSCDTGLFLRMRRPSLAAGAHAHDPSRTCARAHAEWHCCGESFSRDAILRPVNVRDSSAHGTSRVDDGEHSSRTRVGSHTPGALYVPSPSIRAHVNARAFATFADDLGV